MPEALCPGRRKTSRTGRRPTKMIYVGIDLHRKRSQIAALDEHGRGAALAPGRQRPASASRTLLGELGERAAGRAGGDLRLGVAGRRCSSRRATSCTSRIRCARRRSRPRGVKTDAVDARTLAQLLRADLLAGGLRRPARAARPARPAAPPGRADADALGAEEPRARAARPAGRSSASTPTCFGPGGRAFLAELELREPARRRLDSLLR